MTRWATGADSLVREFCGNSREVLDQDSTKLADLQERSTRDFSRPVITAPVVRLKKLAIETGRKHPKTGDLLPPLEPWTCPNHTDAIRTYAQIMRAPDGSYRLADFSGPQLEHIAYMQDEQLITTGPGGTVHALGDKQNKQRKYPGVPVSDDQAKIGSTLKDKGRSLVIASFLDIIRGTGIAVDRLASMLRHGGVGLTIREITTECNVRKSKDPSLAEYRYLHVETCRRIVNDLLESGFFTEIEPPVRHRAGRTWVTISRVYELPPDIAASWPESAPRRKRKRNPNLRHRLRRAA